MRHTRIQINMCDTGTDARGMCTRIAPVSRPAAGTRGAFHSLGSLAFRVVITGVLALLAAGTASAQSAEELRLTVGKTIVIDYPADIRQISTSTPEVIDASPITTREILLTAKGLGNATLVVWSKAGDRMFYNVTVEMNLEPLRRTLKENFPNEAVVPQSSRETVTLNGRVTSKEIADRIMAMTAGFAKTVVNNLVIGAPVDKQILLRVRFAELDRQKEMQYGINWIAFPGDKAISSSTGQFGTPLISQSAAGYTYTIPQALNLLAILPGASNLGLFIKALEAESILQVLAEPNLVTSNGKEAYFLVGGEFPVPMSQGGATAGAITVTFREFGIRLRFTPNITANNTIKLKLNQEVSTLDAAHGVVINGFTIPALSTRKTETEVELGEGQSFVVAGLLDNRETESFSKMPVIGSIPILGNLFKSKDVQKNRTDLILIVTPEVTEPLGSKDPRPEINFPKNFLVRLDQTDLKDPSKDAKKKVK